MVVNSLVTVTVSRHVKVPLINPRSNKRDAFSTVTVYD